MFAMHPKVSVLLLLVQWGTEGTVQCIYIYLLWNFLGIKMSGAVNSNTPHSAPVCIMLNEIAQYLKLFMFFPGVKIMISAS